MSLLDAAGVVTGDIWCSGAFSFESPLKDLLDTGEYSLEQLLAEDELLQELRGMHPQLIEFLSTEENVSKLIRYAILPPENPTPTTFSLVVSAEDDGEHNEEILGKTKDDEAYEEKEGTLSNGPVVDSKSDEGTTKEPGKWLQGEDDVIPIPKKATQQEKDTLLVRFPYMACEVICCEIKGIIDVLVDGFVPQTVEEQLNLGKVQATTPATNGRKTDPRGRTILDLLFSVLYDSNPGEIDDYRAGYFDKVLSVLLRKRPQAMSEYFNSGGGKGSVVLMAAMLKHLYSHSIMQIVQRLLLPQPQLPPRPENQEEQGEEIFGEAIDGLDFDELNSFRCDWSESGKPLEMLLDCLMGKGVAPEIERNEELKLSLYQNASEVLITIVQNSQLTSPTLHALTADPVLERLIVAATSIEKGSSFSNHDSRLTCAMNVLESLILQLGGYGSVATLVLTEGGGENRGETEVPITGENALSEVPVDDHTTTHVSNPEKTFATSETLKLHLPKMLSSLSSLLRYPGAELWSSPMQFSPSKTQRILGSSRLRIVRLLESLVLLGDSQVDSILCSSDCLEVCLDLFWKFQWCSMLHQSVANLLVHVFEGQNSRSDLQSYFLVKCNLLGRLMDSFWEGTEEYIRSPENLSNAKVSHSLMNQKGSESVPQIASSVPSEKGSTDNEILPVSDDDVDSAMEQQEDPSSSFPLTDIISKEGEPNGGGKLKYREMPDHTPPQSFRLGYMGHVIIICQALVHACTIEDKNEARSLAGDAIREERKDDLHNFVDKFDGEECELQSRSADPGLEVLDRGRASESVTTDESPSASPIFLVQLVDAHPLSKKWHEFISTTLASEMAIQSTPLGGIQGGSPGIDPLHAHRPGLAEDGAFDDDDGSAPPLPPRGLLVGGDVIDMDDNDLDVAASMMAGLRLHQPDESGDDRPSDLLSPQANGTSHGGYIFDDPLGDGRFGKFNAENDDDNGNSSSDEESEFSGNTRNSGGIFADGIDDSGCPGDEAPVIDLFAGNFDAFGDRDEVGQIGTWSDFANFDDAFGGGQPEAIDPTGVETRSTFDDIFGDAKDHAILLEE